MEAMALSEELKADINTIRETALQLREEMKSPTIKGWLDQALADLDFIPRMLDSEIYIRQALIMPNARIRQVVRIRETYGANAEVFPSDFGYD
jgi:hypothetical protein